MYSELVGRIFGHVAPGAKYSGGLPQHLECFAISRSLAFAFFQLIGVSLLSELVCRAVAMYSRSRLGDCPV